MCVAGGLMEPLPCLGARQPALLRLLCGDVAPPGVGDQVPRRVKMLWGCGPPGAGPPNLERLPPWTPNPSCWPHAAPARAPSSVHRGAGRKKGPSAHSSAERKEGHPPRRRA